MLYTKLRSLRKNRKITLKSVSNAVGISLSYLSQLESGKTEPSVSTLEKLSRYYKVATTCFFDENIKVPNCTVIKKNERKQVLSLHHKVVYENLLGHKSNVFEAICIKLSPDTNHLFSARKHVGEELIIVIKGILTINYDSAKYLLHPGDCMHYDPSIPISFINDNNDNVELIAFCSPPFGAYTLVNVD